MARAKQPRLERLDALGQRLFEVERADDAILGGAERQVDDGHRHLHGFQRAGPGAAIGAQRGFVAGVAAVAAALDGLHFRQQRAERADRGRLAGASVAEDEDATDRRVDGGDQDAELHVVLSDNGGKRIGHGPLFAL